MKESQIAEYREQLQNYERKNVDLSVQVSDLQQQVRDSRNYEHLCFPEV